MTEKVKNILIGLFVTAAVTIVVAMILFLEPKVGDGKKTIRVRFANISGIVVGTRVAFAGKPVGEVIHIREVPDAREHPDEFGRVFSTSSHYRPTRESMFTTPTKSRSAPWASWGKNRWPSCRKRLSRQNS